MKLYENAYASNYEELKTYYPVWYRDVLEMDALWRVFGDQLDAIQKGVIQAVDNNFIDTADLETIIKLERFLYITYDGLRTLSERRRLVKSFLVGFGKMSAPAIREIVFAFTGDRADVTLEPFDESGNNCLYIMAYRGDTETLFLADLESVLRKKLPAHIQFQISIRFTLSPVVVETPRVLKSVFDYPLCGTRPEPALIGGVRGGMGVETQVSFVKSLIDYPPASESAKSGTLPEEATIGKSVVSDITGSVEIQSSFVDYVPCGTKFAG